MKWLTEQILKHVVKPAVLRSVLLRVAVLVLEGCQLRDEPPKPPLNAELNQGCGCGDQEVVVHISTHKLPEIERRAIWRWFFENGNTVERHTSSGD